MTETTDLPGRLVRDERHWAFGDPRPQAPWVPPHRLRVWEFASGKLLAMVTDNGGYTEKNTARLLERIREDHPGRAVEIIAYEPGGAMMFCGYTRMITEGPEAPHWALIPVTEYDALVARLEPPFEIDDEEAEGSFFGTG
ncbi:hypothetical protein [Actinoplanes derwentensis]|uniref:Uncharacterized protein n=1 Tax=Actinoplanes derwentensis TaxID=113562 RepID=A0A1H1RNX9_9ACTN|nr:hypothetical protein [Actinoplanes derwentensis]GID84481.1 hypothetical protein Ade03nite_34050 [Actinoplanes derwentensis]SDS37405.1 hypothetical protein SAMN04489716_0645 [Actinoplanes derwentensis]